VDGQQFHSLGDDRTDEEVEESADAFARRAAEVTKGYLDALTSPVRHLNVIASQPDHAGWPRWDQAMALILIGALSDARDRLVLHRLFLLDYLDQLAQPVLGGHGRPVKTPWKAESIRTSQERLLQTEEILELLESDQKPAVAWIESQVVRTRRGLRLPDVPIDLSHLSARISNDPDEALFDRLRAL